jgi:hypothetical protein
MEWFNNWWGALDLMEQILYCVAIPSSLFLILQAILIVVGGGDSEGGLDMDAEFDYSAAPKDFGAASMFSLQGFASFFCALGWGSLLLYQSGIPPVFAIMSAFLLGVAVMFAIAKVMFYLSKLAQSGTLEVNKLVGCTGSVYLTIPPKGEGKGKVMVQTSERLLEFEAVSESGTAIANNVIVQVVDIIGENVLVVEKQENSK